MMNRTLALTSLLAASFMMGGAAFAQAPAGAPAGSTGICKDGTYSSQATKKGACRGHKGVKDWYAAAEAAPAASPAASPAAKAVAPMATPAAPAAAAPTAAAAPSKKPAAFTPPADAAPGGGPGMVWVNGSVYHCSGTKWYGKTKAGSYMSEADAKAKGAHADHGKACTA
jgi:hypothetical protein